MSRIHKTNQKKWMEKNNASNRKYNTGKRAIPWRGQGAQHKRERNEKKKPRKSKDTAKVKDNCARARTGTSANERKPEEARQEGKTKDVGKGKGTNQASKPPWKESQPGGKGKRERRQRKCTESTVHEFDTRCDRNRPVPPP